jgi:guanine nucleotide-binding protein subunit alpha
MGICMSTNNEDVEQKKRSQAIDRKLEEDSKRLRRECKILLLGKQLKAVPMSSLSSEC